MSSKQFIRNIIMLGAPGVGKGSYSARASQILNIPHLATGSMIREEISSCSDLGRLFKSFSERGQLIPDNLVIDLLMNSLEEIVSSRSGCLLDGFPRTIQQVESMVDSGFQLGGSSSSSQSDFFAVNMIQDEEIIIQTMMNRKICSVCCSPYVFTKIDVDGYDFQPLIPEIEGVCDTCGSKDSLIQREDDSNEDVIRDRLKIYHDETEPIVEVFEELGILREFFVRGGTKEMMPTFIEFVKEF